ncbi:MAG: LysR family transcriptional regulator, partial [Parasphingorhabdus sp.]|nr:LysR family transcriptional regulator [Parasphingorhabdus sp.]
MLTRQQIRQFLAVVDTGSFTRAAEAIGVTQPTLSSGIRELETHVGASLFD